MGQLTSSALSNESKISEASDVVGYCGRVITNLTLWSVFVGSFDGYSSSIGDVRLNDDYEWLRETLKECTDLCDQRPSGGVDRTLLHLQ